jgi:hypothetical protein
VSLEFDASDFFRHLDAKEARAHVAAVRGTQDAMDDLQRIAVDIAPIESGILRASAKSKVTAKLNADIIGEVTFSAINKDGNGRFNYALWTHEFMENLGTLSAQSPGTDGYAVGNKYLERPLMGEAEKYLGWIAEEIKKEMD